MKTNPISFLLVIVALVSAALFVPRCTKVLNTEGVEPDSRASRIEQLKGEKEPPAPGSESRYSEIQSGPIAWPIAEPSYQLLKAESSFDPAVDAARRKDLRFRMFASGGVGKITDTNGNIIDQSNATNAIFGLGVSPDQERIVINRGDAEHNVITPKTKEQVRLPKRPPGSNVLGFASWQWVDDNTLVGVSGKTIPFRVDQVGPDREEPIISRSVLYVYDLRSRTMSEVALPHNLATKTVSISAVDETGKVQLRPEGRNISFTDASLGWFEIRPVKK
jgi:hypothetical protein